jgi:hypothetical protein
LQPTIHRVWHGATASAKNLAITHPAGSGPALALDGRRSRRWAAAEAKGGGLRSIIVFLAAWALSSAGSAQQDYIPAHERTPGSISPEITQENIAETVCIPGYTKTIRPPTSYTEKLRQRQMG